jgi:hypothetical protein
MDRSISFGRTDDGSEESCYLGHMASLSLSLSLVSPILSLQQHGELWCGVWPAGRPDKVLPPDDDEGLFPCIIRS